MLEDLPEKSDQVLYCDLSPDQRVIYEEVRKGYRSSLLHRADAEGMNRIRMHVLEALLRLRQVACHPALVDDSWTGVESAKLELLLPRLERIIESGHRALVYSQFTSFLKLVRTRLSERGIECEILTGETRDRAGAVRRFQAEDGKPVFLLSLKAGGVGLNLTAADYVFLLDPWWNPAAESQAVDRAHRYGQQRKVMVYRMIARETVEERVRALQKTKRELAEAVLGMEGQAVTGMTRKDLVFLLS